MSEENKESKPQPEPPKPDFRLQDVVIKDQGKRTKWKTKGMEINNLMKSLLK